MRLLLSFFVAGVLMMETRADSPGGFLQPVSGALMPRVSPDQKSVVVSYQGAIAKVAMDDIHLIILSTGEGWDIDPAWSPDSRRIVYVNSPNFSAGILKCIESDSGKEIKLPKTVRAQGPLWFHPDGRRVLGRFSTTGAPQRIAWVDLETCDVTPVSFGSHDERLSQQFRAPYTLSADGKHIYLVMHPDKPGEQTGNNGPNAELFVSLSSGGILQSITTWPARIYAISPDAENKGIFAVTDVGASHNDIWHIPLADPSTGPRKLTSGQADEDSPSNAGSDHFVYSENSGGATTLVFQEFYSQARKTISMCPIKYPGPTSIVFLHTAGAPVARVSIKQKGGKFFAHTGSPYFITAGLGHFYAHSGTQLDLPAGKYELRAFCGPEHRVFQTEFEVAGPKSQGVTISLKRWTDPAARGWYSGENHIHANYGYGAWYNTPKTIFDQLQAEDLRVGNIVVANSDGDGVFDREFFTGKPHPLSTGKHILYWNQEFRSTIWGHMTLFNLSQLVEPIFTGFKGTTNPWDVPSNADIAERVRAQNGVASYTHPSGNANDFYDQPYSAKGLPVDVALGRLDTMDVMGWVYEPSMAFWYRLLNCGFRLPAAAGTDCFLNRVQVSPLGWGRVYVHVAGKLTYEQWIEGLKAGRSFVSNGPMLEFSANEKPIGETIRLSKPGPIRIRGRADAQFPLQTLELVHNGQVIAKGQLSDDKLGATIDQEVSLDRSGWITLRTSGPAVLHWLGRTHAAHTNPIYVEIDGHPQDTKADAEYFLQWIDRLHAALKERNRLHTGRAHIEMQLEAARAEYRKRLNARKL